LLECVVVGAGVFGSWSAKRLRESGRTVALVDAFGPGNAKSSSGGASRVIRMGYGADEIYTRWSMASLEAWKSQSPNFFRQTGVLWTAQPGHPHAEGSMAVFRRCGIRHEVLSAAELSRRFPAMSFDRETIGIFEPESGALLANQAVCAVAGADTIEGRVIPFREEGRLERLTFTDGRTLVAEKFIFACGPWLSKLFPRAVGQRIRVTRQPLFYFEAPAAGLPVWLDFSDPRGPYTIPPLDGKGFKVALDRHGAAFDPDEGSRVVTEAETAAARQVLGERFPALSCAPVVETEVCQYESTSNGDFLIDRHPGMSNVWLVGGGSGHGFKHGPAVGQYVAELLNGGATEERFSWRSKREVAARTVY
jgi:glycine/D-amino acid oxidase-like deaminating enzyme